jgi:hypothetical protein
VTSRVLPILVLLLCAGCRSDGGFGRQDSARGMRFASDRVASRFQTDCKRTKYLFASIPSALEDSFTEGAQNVSDTYHLYLENHAPR